jgi:2-methylaconitate cis-trans-isomerase PrpF
LGSALAKQKEKEAKKEKKRIEVEAKAEAKVAKVEALPPEPKAPDQWMIPGEMRVDLTENTNKLTQFLQQCGNLAHRVVLLKEEEKKIGETVEKIQEDIETLSKEIANLERIRLQMLDKACYKQNVLASMYDFNLQQGIAIKKQEFK